MASAVDGGRIAKNTLVLYFRMFFQMIVYLYTSRVVIDVLGVDDFGIYDVVGGVVIVLTFLNNAMTTATQRFITYALGRNDSAYLNRVYSVSIIIHVFMALGIFVVGETLGLWYVSNCMDIPELRKDSAMVVYHCSLVASMIMVMSVPYNATIISNERMTAFASISILDVTLKLAIVLSLNIVPGDKLQMYALMMVAEALVIRFIYGLYCSLSFKNIKFGFVRYCKLYTEMFKFAGWSTFGNLSIVCNTQGLNLVLNSIGGVSVNAARAIAFQVQSAMTSFILSFQTAINPQITKQYAAGDVNVMNSLVLRSSRISFMLMMFIALPLMLEIEQIMELWLPVVPEYAPLFTRLLICVAMVDAISNPMMIGAAATGNVKKYYLVVGLTLLSALPISILVTWMGAPVEYVFVVQLLVVIVAQVLRMMVCKELFGFSVLAFIRDVMLKTLIVLIVGSVLPICAHLLLRPSVLSSICVCIIAIVSVGITVYFGGLTPEERMFVRNKIRQ